MSFLPASSRHEFLTEVRAVGRLATPFALVQLGMMGLGVVDTMMVGRVSESAMAAVALGHVYTMGLALPLIGVLLSLDPLVAQAHGAGNRDAVSVAMKRGMVLAVLLYLPFLAACQAAAPVLRLLGQQEEVIPVAAAYSRAVAPGFLALLVFVVMRQSLQAMSIVRPILIAVGLGNVANVLLNLAFVFGHFGCPAMGAVGSGWASTGSRLLMVLVLIYASRPVLRPFWRRHTPDVLRAAALGRMLRVGIPIGVQLALEMWGFIAVSLVMGHLGVRQLAGHQIAINLASISFMVPLAIGAAAATRVGNALGRGDGIAARCSARAALMLGGSVMTVSALSFLLLPRVLARAYTPDLEVIATAAALLPIAGVFQVFDGTQAVGCGVLRGAADTRVPMLVNLLGYWVLALPIGLALAFWLDLGPSGLWWGLTLGLAVVAVLLVVRIVRRLHSMTALPHGEDPP